MMLNGGQERKSRLIRAHGVSSKLLLGFASLNPTYKFYKF
jgi:hypothetical protein